MQSGPPDLYRLLLASTSFAVCAVAGEGGLRIVDDYRAVATIAIADQPAPAAGYGKDGTVRDVAKVLQDYVGRVTGARLPLTTEKDARPDSETVILVGATQRGRRLGISPTGLPPEGYRIRTYAGVIAIVGEVSGDGADRGVAFGVYDFLDRVAYVRWYFPGEIGTVVPNWHSLSTGPLDVTNAPHFEMRIGGVDHWQPDEARAWHPALRFGRRDGMVANHTHEQWHRLYGKALPEIFAIRADGSRAITAERHATGQSRSYLCYSAPALLKHYVKIIDDYFQNGNRRPWTGASARPSKNVIPFGPNDNREICLCPCCKPQIQEERGRWGKSSDLIFPFVRKLATQVKERHPQAVIWTLAYDHYQLPATNVSDFPDNLGVTLCLIPTVVQMNHPGVRARNRELIDRWFELVHSNRRRLVVWDYFVHPNCWIMAPTELPRTMKAHVSYLRDRALGIFNNGFSLRRKAGPKAYLSLRMVWLMHQLLWNPDLDLEQARRAWCRDLFGPALQEMDRFYKILEDRWEGVVWSQEPKVGYVGENSIFAETYPAPVVQELEGLFDDALDCAAPGSQARKRLDWFSENCFGPFFEEARRFHAASGMLRSYCAAERASPIRVDGTLDEADWKKLRALKLSDRRLGDDAPDETRVMVLHDDKALYVGAKLHVEEPTKMVAEAQGRENTAVERDDMFLLHLQPPGRSGYVELAVNPKGSLTSQADVMRTRGFFPSHAVIPWKTDALSVASKIEDNTWCVEVAIPWTSLPGHTARPKELRAQFIRWCRKDQHHFHCWSPVLSSWDYPLSRFGRLIFHQVPTESLTIIPRPSQAGRVAGVSRQPNQPSEAEKADPRHEALIVGQRDIGGTSWVEQRGILIFDLSALRGGPDAVASARLTVHHVNAIQTPPYDDVVVDHIRPSHPKRARPQDYHSRALHDAIGTILHKGHVGSTGAYHLDVTDYVKADLASGRTVTAFRLRIPNGCTCGDGKLHYSIFAAVGKESTERTPSLTVERYEVE